jgi:hypothetical protein
MRRFLNSPWMVTLLCAVATFFVAQSFFDWKGPARHAPGPARTTVIDEPADEDEVLIKAAGSITEALAQLAIPVHTPDPFRSARGVSAVGVDPTIAPEQVETLRLTAIWEQGPSLFLLVNNRVREVGERVGQIVLESATMDGVWLSHRQGRDFLPFGGVFSLVTPARDTGADNSNHDEL